MSIPNHTTPEQLPLFGVIEIPLSQGRHCTVDAIDADLSLFVWSAGFEKNGYYATRHTPMVNNHRTMIKMHRVILERILGRPLIKGEYCDHIDRNTLNNQRSNLRLANSSQNQRNRSKPNTNTSGYKWVYRNRTGKWCVRVQVDGVKHYSGVYDTAEEAYQVACQLAERLHGEFVRLA